MERRCGEDIGESTRGERRSNLGVVLGSRSDGGHTDIISAESSYDRMCSLTMGIRRGTWARSRCSCQRGGIPLHPHRRTRTELIRRQCRGKRRHCTASCESVGPEHLVSGCSTFEMQNYNSLECIRRYSILVSTVGGCHDVGAALVRQYVVRGVQVAEDAIAIRIIADGYEVHGDTGGEAYCILHV